MKPTNMEASLLATLQPDGYPSAVLHRELLRYVRKSIYHQRNSHRLIEDWQYGFCGFVEGLPYFREFINQ